MVSEQLVEIGDIPVLIKKFAKAAIKDTAQEASAQVS